MKIYIVGPMSGIPEFNANAFDDAEQYLENLGHEVISPVSEKRKTGFDFIGLTGNEELSELGLNLKEIIISDVNHVLDSDAIYMLEGWHDSSGALAEIAVANWAGKQIFHAGDDMSKVK